MILNACEGKKLPIYGDGSNVRDWLHVEDHCHGILAVLEKGQIGETYCIGGDSEKTNLEVIETLCSILDDRRPEGYPHDRLISSLKTGPVMIDDMPLTSLKFVPNWIDSHLHI